MTGATVNVRYMVDDVDAAVEWYTKHLGFSLLSNVAPAFAESRWDRCGCCWQGRPVRPDAQCRMGPSPDPAVGTASIWS
jgi:catechol 2,3-dioxygenase-like lactoylglutathione lyase family enzyme